MQHAPKNEVTQFCLFWGLAKDMQEPQVIIKDLYLAHGVLQSSLAVQPIRCSASATKETLLPQRGWTFIPTKPHVPCKQGAPKNLMCHHVRPSTDGPRSTTGNCRARSCCESVDPTMTCR